MSASLRDVRIRTLALCDTAHLLRRAYPRHGAKLLALATGRSAGTTRFWLTGEREMPASALLEAAAHDRRILNELRGRLDQLARDHAMTTQVATARAELVARIEAAAERERSAIQHGRTYADLAEAAHQERTRLLAELATGDAFLAAKANRA